MRRTVLLLFLLLLSAHKLTGQPYRNAALPVDERVEDLLSRMTTEEKVAQLLCPLGWQYDERTDTVGVGMLWATFRADPWTGRTLENGLRPSKAARRANELQHHAVDETRLGIPLLLAEEAPHGHMAIGTTTFPTGLGMGATFNRKLLERVGTAIAREISHQGAHIAFGPVLDLARDPRWSRTEECMGEDPLLVGELGAALVRGMKSSLAVTLKHFAAYGIGAGGQNGAAVSLGRHELQRDYLPPFRRAIEAGASGIMTAYGAIDGTPCTSNPWLLRDILRREWRFRGFVISDLYSINVLHNTLHIAASLEVAAKMAIQAGVDVDLGAEAFGLFKEKSEQLKIDDELDVAVRRILRLKFEMGLFEHPYVDESLAEEVHGVQDVALALEVARASITLLKNEAPAGSPIRGRVLPLAPGTKIALVGPNADNVYAQLGDYTAPQPDGKVVTVRQGLLSKGLRLVPANEADVIVAVVGGSSSRYSPPQSPHEGGRASALKYLDTGAALPLAEDSDEWEGNTLMGEMQGADSGEGLDRISLDLMGYQQALLDSMSRMGKPLVVVYIEGRPLLKNWAAGHADALLTAYYPGEQGGMAIADVLVGDYNPAGRLPVSQPRNVGQLPVYYSRPLPPPHDYVEGTAQPLYPFGHGLSYTTFEYSDLNLSPQSAGKETEVTFTLRNTGKCDGEEVAQLYVHREGTGFVEPERELVAFERVFIPQGESRTVKFTLRDTPPCTLMVGASSQDIRLTAPLNPLVRGDLLPTDALLQEDAYEWPKDSLVVDKLHNWQDLKFGILLHWGLYSVPGIVESWSICDEDWIRRDTTMTYDQYKHWYWSLANGFRPTRFDPNQWAEVAEAAGMKYMLFTTKHHDGFCLWDSHETAFTAAHFDGRDFLSPVLQAFRQRGMMTGAYFSKPDWHSQSYWWDVFPTKGRNVNYPLRQYPARWEQFKQFTYNQLKEIMTGYGPLDILWLDGGWVCKENGQDIDMPRIAAMARREQPGLIIVDRTIHGSYENYRTPERTIPEQRLDYPWESCIPLSDDWGGGPRPRWKSARQVINMLIEVVGKGGNLVLGVGPTADGLIEPEAELRLRAIGQWLKKNGRAIYGTRPLPLMGDSEGAFTISKDGRRYALFTLPEGETLPKALSWTGLLPQPGATLRLVSTGQRLRWKIQDGRVTVTLPKGLADEPLAIEF